MIETKSPVLCGRDRNGHLVFEITGCDRMAEEDGVWSGYAETYNSAHRLRLGRKYRVVFFPVRSVSPVGFSRQNHLLRRTGERLGYSQPLAGVAPRLRARVVLEAMKREGFNWVTVMHEPLAYFLEEGPMLLSVSSAGVIDSSHGLFCAEFDEDVACCFLLK